MLDCATAKHGDVRRAATHVNETNAELFLIVRQHRVARCELLEDDVLDVETTALHALDDVLRGAHGARNEMHLGF